MVRRKQTPESEPLPIVVKDSTDADRALATEIIEEELGSMFTADFSFPKNTGQQGDQGVRGDTLLITTPDVDAARLTYEQSVVTDEAERIDKQDGLGHVSNRLTNELPAVTRVLYEIVIERR